MTDRLDLALTALRKILRATEISSRALAKQCGLSPSQLILMEIIANDGEASPSKLANRLSLSHATMTALLDRLGGMGLITRSQDSSDKRRFVIRLTAEGRATLANAPDFLQQRFSSGFARMAEWEQSSLVAALDRTVALLDAVEIDAAPVLDVGAINKETH